MVNVSNSAKEHIKQLIKEENHSEDAFLRVSVIAGGCSGFSYKLDFDTELTPEDEIYEDNGVKLVCDPRSVLYLFGTVLEYTTGLNGKGFEFNNPNATRTCACGESFSV